MTLRMYANRRLRNELLQSEVQSCRDTISRLEAQQLDQSRISAGQSARAAQLEAELAASISALTVEKQARAAESVAVAERMAAHASAVGSPSQLKLEKVCLPYPSYHVPISIASSLCRVSKALLDANDRIRSLEQQVRDPVNPTAFFFADGDRGCVRS